MDEDKRWYAVAGATVEQTVIDGALSSHVKVVQFFAWASSEAEAKGEFIAKAAVKFPGRAFGGLVAKAVPPLPPSIRSA